MSVKCQCDIVRDGLGGVEIRGTIQAYTCNCSNRSIPSVTFQLSNRTGFFASWPASLQVILSPIAGCNVYGETSNIDGDPDNLISLEYVDTTPRHWTWGIASNYLSGVITTVTGLNGFLTTTYIGAYFVSTGSLDACYPSSIPGAIANITTDDGDTIDVTCTIP